MGKKLYISFVVLMLIASEAWADVVVIVRREAEAGGNYVRVCDIARVEGPREQAAEVARTVLGPTPARGQALEISRWDIESRLYEMGVSAAVQFSGNDTVTVFGAGAARRGGRESIDLQPLNPIPQTGALSLNLGDAPQPAAPVRNAAGQTGANGANSRANASAAANRRASALDSMAPQAKVRVGQAVSSYLAEQYQRRDVEVEASVVSVSEAVPYDAAEVVVDQALGGKVPGKATLRLLVRDEAGSEPRHVTVSADTQVYGLALVASKKLQRGHILGKRDVRVQRIKMESGKGYFPPKPTMVEGREIKVNLEPGKPVLASDTELAEAVKRGDTVVIETVGRGWQVQGTGTALDSGMIGDLIAVQDSNTKTKIPTRITGLKKVEVLNNNNR